MRWNNAAPTAARLSFHPQPAGASARPTHVISLKGLGRSVARIAVATIVCAIVGFLVTDTAYLRNPHYHTVHDTAEKLDYVRMASVVDGVLNAVMH